MNNASRSLCPLDQLSVDIVTDDVSDNYVSKTLFAVSEFANIVRAGAKTLSGEALLCANLGFGCRLTSTAAGMRHAMLFDTGPEGAIFLRNCANLGIALGEIECIAVSHGHWDHMAALPATLDAIREQGGKATVHVNPGMFNERAVRLGQRNDCARPPRCPRPKKWRRRAPDVVNDPAARLLLDDHFYYSGEIPRLSAFEKGRTDHLSRTGPERAVGTRSAAARRAHAGGPCPRSGTDCLSSCSHAGIVNVCTEVRHLFPRVPIHCVMGGLHLGGVMERIIPDTVEGLRPFAIPHIITGHCTGWRALHALANAFGDARQPVGGRHDLHLRRLTFSDGARSRRTPPAGHDHHRLSRQRKDHSRQPYPGPAERAPHRGHGQRDR